MNPSNSTTSKFTSWTDPSSTSSSPSYLGQVDIGAGIILFFMGGLAGIVAFAACVKLIDDLIMRRYFPSQRTIGSEVKSILRWLFPDGPELPRFRGVI